jgi:hypothetical protein
MAKSARIVLNRAGVRELLKCPGVQADLARRAERIAAAAGPGMVAESYVGRNRARSRVYTQTPEARRAEASDRTLTRAIDAGRG